jgi:hypothetical protein
MDPSSTASITEFAIVVAGFTGLVLAIGSKDGAADPLVKFRVISMLFFTFTAAFGSLLPTLAQSMQIAQIWNFSSYVLAVLLVSNMIASLLSAQILLSPEERRELKAWMWSLVLIGNSLFAIFLLVTLAGLVAIPVAGAFFAALIWQLVLSAVLFTRLILQG